MMGGEDIKVLHIAGDPASGDAVATSLEGEDGSLHVTSVSDTDDALTRFRNGTIDCIVSAYDLSGMDGLELLEIVREADPDMPVILFTGKGSEDVASDAISAGVTDYLQKQRGSDQYAVLANRIVSAVERVRTERQCQRHLEAIETAREGISILDEDGHFVYVNEEYASLYGYSPEAMIGEHWELVYRDDDVERIHEEILPAVEATGYWRGTTTGRKADGSTFLEDHTLALTAKGELVCVVRDVTDESDSAAELEELSNRYRVYVEQAMDLITVLGDDGTINYQSHAANRILGYAPTELIGDVAFDHVHPDDRARVRERFSSAINDPEPRSQNLTFRFRHADGSWVWLEAAISNRTGPGIDGYVITSRDVTDRVQSSRQLQTTLDNLPGYVYRHRNEPGWPLTFVRGSPEAVTGYTAEELGSDVNAAEELIHPEDRDAVRTGVTAGLESDGRYDLTYRILTRDGETRWVWDRGMVVEDPVLGEDVLDGFVTDITEQKERERELRRTRKEYEQVINGMNDSAWVIGTDEQFIAVNDAAVERMGYSRAELLEMSPHDIDVGLDDDRISEIITTMPDDEIQVFETIHETSDGEQIPVEISSSLITYRGETAVLSIARDITQRKRREQRLADFASIVSHDLRNPLTLAQGRLEMVSEECDSEHIGHVEYAHDRMNTLIDDLLTLARHGDDVSDFETVALEALVADCWRTIDADEAAIAVDTTMRLRADRTRVVQLLENVFRNAVDHAGPSVTITVGELSDDDGFYVEDDGPGIPAADRKIVFEAGYSTTNAGTGIGLAIVERIAEAHDWEITLTDGSTGGARFEFRNVTVGSQ